ncbi:uroporphyrinogen-III C-methyltransferase [Halopseudomonas pachastrellae]|nr:uroporphyrinogen-III C-methyltransferase [Halopseudomonas pachastrellae]
MEPSEANDKTEQQPAAAAATKPAEPVAAASDKKGSDGKRPKPGKPAAGGGGRGVSLLALLLALIALAASGWQWWQAQSLQQAQRNALAQQQAQLDRANLRLDQRLQGVPQGDDWQAAERLIAEMQRSQQALGERLNVLQGDGREEWKLAEAQYLLRLAALRLQAVQDVSAARELLETVDGILKSMPDSGLYGVREQLAGYQAELEGLPELDRAGVFLRLGAPCVIRSTVWWRCLCRSLTRPTSAPRKSMLTVCSAATAGTVC